MRDSEPITGSDLTRPFDIFLAIVALSALAPLLVAVCVLLRLTGERKIFYRQNRIGRGGCEFELFKFVTMLEDSPNLGAGDITEKDDPRVLPVGRFLRASKLNEIPQLLNILKGDMSLIGPRPLTPRIFDMVPGEYKLEVTKHRPGLSGIGSVIFRDEESVSAGESDAAKFYKEHIAPYKSQLEVWFNENFTLGLYLKLIALTIWVVIFPKSSLVWRLFTGLPRPPGSISKKIQFPG